jgi:hypothetical protein
VGAGYGTVNSYGMPGNKETDAFITYAIKDRLNLTGTYLKTDASLLLYSSNLVEIRYNADHYRLSVDYEHPNGILINGISNILNIIKTSRLR